MTDSTSHKVLTNFRQLRDEFKVKSHLLKKDVQDQWYDLQGDFDEIEMNWDKLSDKAKEEFINATTEAVAKWNEVKSTAEKLPHDVREKFENATEAAKAKAEDVRAAASTSFGEIDRASSVMSSTLSRSFRRIKDSIL